MVLSSGSAPVLSGKKQREQNEEERDETERRRKMFSVPVVPVDPLTDTDATIDRRMLPGVG